MLRILHPTYQWEKSAKGGKKARQWFRFVLLPFKQTDRRSEAPPLHLALYSPVQPAVSSAVRWKDAHQTEVHLKSRPFLLRAHTHSRGVWGVPSFTRREKGIRSGLLMHLEERCELRAMFPQHVKASSRLRAHLARKKKRETASSDFEMCTKIQSLEMIYESCMHLAIKKKNRTCLLSTKAGEIVNTCFDFFNPVCWESSSVWGAQTVKKTKMLSLLNRWKVQYTSTEEFLLTFSPVSKQPTARARTFTSQDLWGFKGGSCSVLPFDWLLVKHFFFFFLPQISSLFSTTEQSGHAPVYCAVGGMVNCSQRGMSTL